MFICLVDSGSNCETRSFWFESRFQIRIEIFLFPTFGIGNKTK